MKNFIAITMALSLTACATCKSTDTPDVCRTKQRENGHPRSLMPLASAMSGPVDVTGRALPLLSNQ